MTPSDLAQITEELVSNLGLSLKADVTQDGELYLVNLNGSDVRLLERGVASLSKKSAPLNSAEFTAPPHRGHGFCATA